MTNPVLIVQTGHTYERTAIERWLRGHSTDPRPASPPALYAGLDLLPPKSIHLVSQFSLHVAPPPLLRVLPSHLYCLCPYPSFTPCPSGSHSPPPPIPHWAHPSFLIHLRLRHISQLTPTPNKKLCNKASRDPRRLCFCDEQSQAKKHLLWEKALAGLESSMLKSTLRIPGHLARQAQHHHSV
jgi:hypothetical protein